MSRDTRLTIPRSRSVAKLAMCALSVGLLVSCARESDAVIFQDATESAGISAYAGMTHGAAWGDFDGDGLPDLYVTNHLNDPLLFRNLGGGRFAEVTAQFFSVDQLKGDKHGAQWADFDNDGRLDLIQLTGAIQGAGSEPKRLFHNEGGRFVDVAEAQGVNNAEGRTRMPLWLDLNGDGKLDMFQGAEARFDDKTPPFTFVQGPQRFDPADMALMLGSRSVPFCVLSELTGDDKPDLVCRLIGHAGAVKVFDLSSLPAKSLDLLPQTGFEDIATADFDNDGRMDVFMARRNAPGPVALGLPSDKQVVASLSIDKNNAGQAMGFSFRAKGPVQVKLAAANPRDALTPERIHLGAQGAHPAGLSFTVEPGVGDLAPHTPGEQTGVYIGFTAPDKWAVRVTAPREALIAGKPMHQELQVAVTAAEAISSLEAVGEVKAEEAPLRLFMNRGGKLVEESEKRGLNKRLVAGMNVVVGDFDNDMNVDIFVLASGDIGMQQNLLLLNDGKGHFKAAKAAGGAGGRLSGVGDSVTTVDFDRDGFLDLLVASGGSMGRSLGLPSDSGGYRLYRNVANGNGNHWLMIDLEGTRSNRDGIGAIVRVTAGGVTQMRMQDGGVHHRSQNHARLHFGLAKNTQAEKISVHWPNGQVQELKAVKSDQVLRIKEPAAAS